MIRLLESAQVQLVAKETGKQIVTLSSELNTE
jgi:hypothetical protein